MAISNSKEWDERILTSVAEQGLSWYQGRVGVVDYTHAAERFAVNATLLYGMETDADPVTGFMSPKPTPETEALIVRRGSGDGAHGSWSGVSGFVDHISTPGGHPLDNLIVSAVQDEFREEGGVSEGDLARVTWWADQHDVWPTPAGELVLLPVVGHCSGNERPAFTPDGTEVIDCAWVPLDKLHERSDMAEGYLGRTLIIGLGSIASQEVIQGLIGK